MVVVVVVPRICNQHRLGNVYLNLFCVNVFRALQRRVDSKFVVATRLTSVHPILATCERYLEEYFIVLVIIFVTIQVFSNLEAGVGVVPVIELP